MGKHFLGLLFHTSEGLVQALPAALLAGRPRARHFAPLSLSFHICSLTWEHTLQITMRPRALILTLLPLLRARCPASLLHLPRRRLPLHPEQGKVAWWLDTWVPVPRSTRAGSVAWEEYFL